MLALDLSRMPTNSAVRWVARSSGAVPEFVLADRAAPRYVAARWHRRRTCLPEPVRLDQHVLSYCEQGGAVSTLDIDGVRRRARQHSGSITFIPAGSAVRWSLDSPIEVVHLHVYITPSALTVSGMTALQNHKDPWFEAFFRLLLAEHEACRCSGRLGEFDLFDRLGGLLTRRLAALWVQRAAPPAEAGAVMPLRQWLLREVEQYVSQHLADPIHLPELAALTSLSVDHFARAFTRATGSTPHRWLLERRLAAACARLRHGNDPVARIAHDCGFAGAAHFATRFRQRFGVTPTAYRRGMDLAR